MIDRRRLIHSGLGATLALGAPGAALAGALNTMGGSPATSRYDEGIAHSGPRLRDAYYATHRRSTPRRLTFRNLHTEEWLDAVYWENGDYVPDALQAVNHVLRDHRTGEIHPIAPRLLDVLTDLWELTGSKREVQVVSGYRSAQTNAVLREKSAEVAQHSLHMDGMAIDLCVEDVALDHLHAAAMDLSRGGVGYYPVSNFIHVDVGPVRHWTGS